VCAHANAQNADRVASSACERHDDDGDGDDAAQLGCVIVNLQRTRLDDQCALRVWAKTDDVFARLADRLGVSVDLDKRFPCVQADHVFALDGYDEQGKRLSGSLSKPKRLVLRLNPGDRVKVADPRASNVGAEFVVDEWDAEGNVLFAAKAKLAVRKRLGRWFIDAAQRGALDFCPVVNV